MKSVEKILLFAICVAAIVLLAGCSSSDNEPKATVVKGVEVAENLFPSLEGIESAEIEELKYGGDNDRSVPGPADYEYRGYVILSNDAATAYAATYDFTKTIPVPDVSFALLDECTGDWKYSKEFRDKLVPAGYVGDVWLDGTIILFDISST